MASVIVVGKQKTRELELAGAVTVVGRDGGATLELGDLQVSRRHALLVRAAEGFFLKDLGSRNGVLVNKEKVPSRSQTRLKNGDVLSLGRTTLIFKDLAGKLGGPDATQPVAGTVISAPAPAPAPAKTKPGSALAAAKARAAAKSGAVARAAGLKDAPAAKPEAEPATLGSQTTGAGGPPPAPSPAPPEDPKKTDPRSYPRALPPPPSGSGATDALMLRVLERAERDRVFYRNVALALTGVVILVLVGLLLWALLHGRAPAAPPEAPAAVAAPAPARPQVADLSVLDADVFAAQVQPVLAAKCAGCHEQVGRAGGLVLAASDDPATVRANLAAIRRYVVPGRPQESPLLLEPLPAAEGGTGHGGGEVLTMASDEWQALAAWVERTRTPSAPAAAGPKNQAPTAQVAASPTTAPAGQPIALDGTGSADPDGGALTFRWTLRRRPEGSKAVLDRPGESRTQLFVDVPGAYVVALVVHDGQASATAEVEVAATTTPERERAPAIAGAFEALCGRAPSEAEARALAPLEGEALAKALADRPEAYARWWEAELAHLGLEGEHRPRGEPWVSIPDRLRAGRVSALDVLQALCLGQAWSTRHAGRDAAVDALLTRVLGLDPAAATAERDAARRLFDGFEATFLGVEGTGQADLVRIAVSDPRARRALLARAHQRILGRPGPAPILDAAQAALTTKPKELFAILAGWAAQRVP